MNIPSGTKPLFLFNGIPFSPSSNATLISSQFVDSARNANAKVIAQKINRRQVKYDSIQFPYLTASEWSELRRIVENFTVNVTYYDDYEGRILTRLFYFGDSSAVPIKFDHTKGSVAVPTAYVDCRVNIIDMGY